VIELNVPAIVVRLWYWHRYLVPSSGVLLRLHSRYGHSSMQNRYGILIVVIDSHYLCIRMSLHSALAFWYDHLGACDCTFYRWAFPKELTDLNAYIREALVYVIPVGMIQAVTNRQVGLKWAVSWLNQINRSLNAQIKQCHHGARCGIHDSWYPLFLTICQKWYDWHWRKGDQLQWWCTLTTFPLRLDYNFIFVVGLRLDTSISHGLSKYVSNVYQFRRLDI
jgi:hypothetical protein